MINVDVPWVPSELEQRIGRIARLGQKKPVVTVHNLWYPNGIEAEIYRRLILRQKDMWFAIGTFPEQIGDEIRNAVDNQSDFQFDRTLERLNELHKTFPSRDFHGWSKTYDNCDPQSIVDVYIRLSNNILAQHLIGYKLPFIYKEHEEIDQSSINELTSLALDEKDHASYNFLQWFVEEQLEEEQQFEFLIDRISMIGEEGLGIHAMDKLMGKLAVSSEVKDEDN